jgi:hypothetical protein
VREGKLVIERVSGAPSTRRRAQITVTVPELESVGLLGSGDMTVTNVRAQAFRVVLAGSGDLRIGGSVDDLSVDLDGSGDAELNGLAARVARVRLSGSGDVGLAPTELLDVTLNGSGDVHYRGSPRVTQVVRGSGDVRRD